MTETIARMANKEDGVKGHFWEGRFKSQALLDEQAILSVMAYVDLNPIRANMANDLTNSEYTSVFKRLQDAGLIKSNPNKLNKSSKSSKSNHLVVRPNQDEQTNKNIKLTRPGEFEKSFEAKHAFKPEGRLNQLPIAALMPFDAKGQDHTAIHFSMADYIEFVDYLGRAVHPNKQGFITGKTPAIMQKLGLSAKMIEIMSTGLLKRFGSAIGREVSLDRLKKARNNRFLQGFTAARLVYA